MYDVRSGDVGIVQSLAASLNVDEEDEDRELRARSYIR